MLFRPNPSSGVPIHLQLMEQVKRGLETGALRPGEQLPGIRPLAEELVINPNLVAKAYQGLEDQGFITLRNGAGALLPTTSGFPERPIGLADRLTQLAFENRRLAAEIASEVGARALRNRELENAREVQQMLLPHAYPAFDGLDYAGACRPALGVGGDYYDFIRLSETRLGIAIGDVSGKGIPAALLMATLRASLRGQAQSASDPADVMVTLNRALYESSTANRFATFFYAHYDSSTRVLTYVNAGHNPPFIFRAHGSHPEVVRLDPSGPVIGFLPESSYVQRSVVLEPGDLLVAFTDGISEAMNADFEEWGEERLTQAIGAYRGLPARELIDHILRAADGYVAGAAQHDDMTLIAARIT